MPKALMSLGEILKGCAGNLLVAGIVFYLKGPSAGVVCFGLGIALLIVAYFVRKKPEPTSAMTSVQLNPQFNPQSRPQQNVYIEALTPTLSAIEQERTRQEDLVMEFLKRDQPQDRTRFQTRFHEVNVIASAVQLSVRDTWDALERLRAKDRVLRTPLDEARGGFVWALSDLE
jgi:hypothetical protein